MFNRKGRLKLQDGVGAIKSFALDSGKENFYVGTNLNSLMSGSMNAEFVTIAWGHSKQISCVAPHPTENGFVSAGKRIGTRCNIYRLAIKEEFFLGYDKIVARWRQHSIVWKYQANTDCLSVAFHPSNFLKIKLKLWLNVCSKYISTGN